MLTNAAGLPRKDGKVKTTTSLPDDAVLATILTIVTLTLLVGAAIGARTLRHDARLVYAGGALLAIPIASAAIARIAQDATAFLTWLALAALASAQIAALLARPRALWLAAATLPAAGIALGATRSSALAAMLSIPLALILALATPVTVRALAQAKEDGDRSGPLFLLSIVLILGALFGTAFLALRFADA